MKKLHILFFLLMVSIGFSQSLEPKTVVVNGVVINGKTTNQIQSIPVAPNGYVQYSTDTESLWLKTPSGWVNTNTTGGQGQNLATADQTILTDRIVKIDGESVSLDFTDSFNSSILQMGNTVSGEKFLKIPFVLDVGQSGLSFSNPFALYTNNSDPTGQEGSIYYNTVDKELRINDGTDYFSVTGEAGTGLIKTGNVFSVETPFTSADETKLDAINGSETKVVAGTNVSVSGIGTIGSPYQIGIPNYLPLAGGTMGGNINMSGNNINTIGNLQPNTAAGTAVGGVGQAGAFDAIYNLRNVIWNPDNSEYWYTTVSNAGNYGWYQGSNPLGTASATYTLSSTGIPVAVTDLVDKDYVDGIAGGSAQTFSYVGGTLSISGGNSVDLRDVDLVSAYAPGNYTEVSTTIRGQLQGIDAALGSLSGGTDNQNLSLLGNALSIEDGNTVNLPQTLANANQFTPASQIRSTAPGTSGSYRLNDTSGRTWFDVTSNAIGSAEGNGYIGENTTFREHSGTADNSIAINFDFDTGTDRSMVATPTDLTYLGESLLGSGGDTLEALTQAQYDALSQPEKDAFVGVIVDDTPTTPVASSNYSTAFNNQTGTSYTLQNSDALNNTKVRLSNASEITVNPPASPSTGQTFWLEKTGAGDVVLDFKVVKGDSLTDAKIVGRGSSVILAYDGTNYQATGDYLPFTNVETLPNFGTGTELVSVGAYGFPPNEANSINYDVSYPPIGADAVSIADDTNGYGDYVAQLTATNTSNGRARHRISGLTAGQTVRVYILYRMLGGATNGRFHFPVNVSGFPTFTSLSASNWTLLTGTGTVDSTSDIQLDASVTRFGGTGQIGDQMQYKISIKVE